MENKELKNKITMELSDDLLDNISGGTGESLNSGNAVIKSGASDTSAGGIIGNAGGIIGNVGGVKIINCNYQSDDILKH